MKRILLFTVFIACLLFASCSFESSLVGAQSGPENNFDDKKPKEIKTAVLVELFTSEGCASCPPADKLLARLEQEQAFNNVEVITLALHVDYWDRLGWEDEYSSAMFSRRQDIYAQAFRSGQTYTPQMVVDGRTQFVGSKAADASKAISSNAKNQKAKIDVDFEGEKLNVRIAEIPKHERLTVYLAVAEDNLATNVKRGENSGKKLEHVSVVRELRSLGMLSADQNEYSYEQIIQIQPNWKKENLRFVIFIQENESRKILGVSRVRAE